MALEHLDKDLLVTPFFRANEWETVDLTLRPAGNPYRDEPVDLAAAQGVENLQQALVLRLLTPLGSLRDLGHANYGSRLHELIGTENLDAARLQARAYVLQALAQEKRVQEILSLEIAPPTPVTVDRLLISVQVLAVAGGDPVTLGLEVQL
jgi:phage baseplate assembly protein W